MKPNWCRLRARINPLPEERDEDIDTLGGLVVSLVGRVPDRGEIVMHPMGIEFEVINIAGTGHYPMIERPQEFSDLLKKSLGLIVQDI